MTKREDGAGVVIAIGLMALLVSVAIIGGGVVGVVATHRQLQAAADLAALAGASAAQSGDPPCEVADRVATRNGGDVVRCATDGAEVTVVVERRTEILGGGRLLRARARAGPVGAAG